MGTAPGYAQSSECSLTGAGEDFPRLDSFEQDEVSQVTEAFFPPTSLPPRPSTSAGVYSAPVTASARSPARPQTSGVDSQHARLWSNHTEHSREFPLRTNTYAVIANFYRDVPTSSHRSPIPGDVLGSSAPLPSARSMRLSASLDRSQTLPPLGEAGVGTDVDAGMQAELEGCRSVITCLTRPSTAMRPFRCRRGCERCFSMVPDLLHHEASCRFKLDAKSAKNYELYRPVRIPPEFQTGTLLRAASAGACRPSARPGTR
jgi:hypothetical protein